MAEQDNGSAEAQASAQPAEQISNADVRNSSLFRKVASELDELRGKLAQQEAAKKAAEEAEQRKALEARGEYEALTKSLQEKLAATEARHAAEILGLNLRDALRAAGASNPIWLAGAVAAYRGDAAGIAEYVAGLVADEANSYVFATSQPKTIAPASTPISAGQQTNWGTIRAQLGSSDPAAVKAASAAVTAFFVANGKMPPGF